MIEYPQAHQHQLAQCPLSKKNLARILAFNKLIPKNKENVQKLRRTEKSKQCEKLYKYLQIIVNCLIKIEFQVTNGPMNSNMLLSKRQKNNLLVEFSQRQRICKQKGCKHKTHNFYANDFKTFADQFCSLLPSELSHNISKKKELRQMLFILHTLEVKNEEVHEYEKQFRVIVNEVQNQNQINVRQSMKEFSILNLLKRQQKQMPQKSLKIQKIMLSNCFKDFTGGQTLLKNVKIFHSNYCFFQQKNKQTPIILITYQQFLNPNFMIQCFCQVLNSRQGEIYVGLEKVELKGGEIIKYLVKGIPKRIQKQHIDKYQKQMGLLLAGIDGNLKQRNVLSINYVPIENFQSKDKQQKRNCLRITINIKKQKDNKIYYPDLQKKDGMYQVFANQSSEYIVLYNVNKIIETIHKRDMKMKKEQKSYQ